jgi:hypothetical protein
MNVEIGTEAAQFPEKECTNGISLAVYPMKNFYMYTVKTSKDDLRLVRRIPFPSAELGK